MSDDLILMERLEPRENKDILILKFCLGICVYLGASLGVDARAALAEFMAHPWVVAPGSVKEACGYCSIQ